MKALIVLGLIVILLRLIIFLGTYEVHGEPPVGAENRSTVDSLIFKQEPCWTCKDI